MTAKPFQDDDIMKFWNDIFSSDEYRFKIDEIRDNYPQKKSIYVPYPDVDESNPDFASFLLEKPDKCIRIGEKAIRNKLPATWEPSNIVNLRIESLPKDAHIDVRNIRSEHRGRLVAVEGLVRKATISKLKMTNALYRCAKCDAQIWIPQKGMYAKEPIMCTNDACNRSALRFILDEEGSVYSNAQKIEIQENPEGLRGGAQPERLSGYIDDDLAGIVYPGNRVTLNGIIRPVEKTDRDKSLIFDVFIDIISVEFSQEEYEEIEITEEDEKRILEMSKDPKFFVNLVHSVAPSIYGNEMEKEGVALQLFGGVAKEMDDGTVIRGDIHILMMGDPGVAKSQILSYMSRLAPRGIYASGKSTSAAGLCITGDTYIVNDKGEVEKIGDYVNSRMNAPEEYKPGIWRQASDDWRIQSIGDLGSVRYLPITYIWKIKTPEKLYKITAGGTTLTLTPETKIQAMVGATFDWVSACELAVGNFVSIVGQNMRLMPITEIELLTEDLPEYVYDLTIEPSHAFIGNGFVIHNTAAAVKDEFGDGRWTLEAGALVLADKGLACIDELDKMTEHDRSSLHEAMESQKISVAKAGINATLQSRCSLLAAANPKHSRFVLGGDERLSEQINLPASLLSRFDLIYLMTDVPRKQDDEKLARHILRTHRRGQVRASKTENENVDREKILADTDDIRPIYDVDIIRKYVSYAKQNCSPVLSEKAIDMIQEEYIKIRSQGEGEDKPVPITARQLEAYVRLAEASAKSRLSPIADEDDAKRAINLVRYYLDTMMVTGNGTYDCDMLSEFSKKDRDTIKNILSVIEKEIMESEDGLSDEDIIKRHPNIEVTKIKENIEKLHENNHIYRSEGRWKIA